MTFKRIATSFVVLSLAVVPAGRAMADMGDALVGGIVGGIVGGAIVNEGNKNRAKKSSSRSTTYKSTSSGQSSAARNANREVQTALNYFGYPVGTPDGSIGPKSRAAISEYQMTMGWPPTGQLNDFERDLLVTSYYRAQAGGASTAALIASNPRGAKGVLVAWKDERLGLGGAPAAAGTMAAGTLAAGAGVTTFAATPPVAPGAPAMPSFGAVAPAPAPAPAPATAPVVEAGLPSFMGSAQVTQVSLASLCSKVSLVTNSNGGFVTQVTMTDPSFALSEQFCLARTYAISQGEDMIAQVQGFSAAQIAEQCQGFTPVLKDHVAALSTQPRDAVLTGMVPFVQASGMAPAQLAGTAKTCLGVGYQTDNGDLAIGSALILAVLGESAYEELIGHHLVAGIGAAPRPDLALPWFEAALGVPGEAVTQVFAPGMTDRDGLIRMAAYAVAGQPQPGGSVPAPAQIQAPAGAPQTPAVFPSITLPFIGGASKSP